MWCHSDWAGLCTTLHWKEDHPAGPQCTGQGLVTSMATPTSSSAELQNCLTLSGNCCLIQRIIKMVPLGNFWHRETFQASRQTFVFFSFLNFESGNNVQSLTVRLSRRLLPNRKFLKLILRHYYYCAIYVCIVMMWAEVSPLKTEMSLSDHFMQIPC